ncbi:PREDICTED: uncharacterized protein LOC109592558 isoform X3 [Amphimedon queenslandica]|uniref:Uncharacterized protein n=1 Tax=Amphimedon queenslandica TaxID=400682 RepID=A0AAN0K2P5_AMPQE|nr:PREDICTED: uncharacterized protein LOC109592558 isoform X3 [Amphimedon queenslandica]|eukprot:XP_019863543.1 PREDICTED: uncharacterized protein LOC109592558 isoform X3 [Amphimedon queenslandica]
MENTLLASTNPAYGVTGEGYNADVSANSAYGITEKSGCVSANPGYGFNTGGIESINEESLVYDEPRTMYHEQEVTIRQNEAYGQSNKLHLLQ